MLLFGGHPIPDGTETGELCQDRNTMDDEEGIGADWYGILNEDTCYKGIARLWIP